MADSAQWVVPYQPQVAAFATKFATRLGTEPNFIDYFLPRAGKQVVGDIVFFAFPREHAQDWHFDQSQWTLCLRAFVDEHVCTVTFDFLGQINVGHSCTCGDNARNLCPHAARLALVAGRRAQVVDRLVFQGVRKGIDAIAPRAPAAPETPEAPTPKELPALTLEFIRHELKAIAEEQPALSLGKDGLGFQLIQAGGSGASAGSLVLAPVALERDKRKRKVAVRLIKDLEGAARRGLHDPDEQGWLDVLLRFPPAAAASGFYGVTSARHSQLLQDLAASGRLIGPDGTRLKVATDALAKTASWVEVSELAQQLKIELGADWRWLSPALGLVYTSAHHALLDLGMSQKTLERIRRWPPVAAENVQSVLEQWVTDPVLRRLPPPPKMQTLPIRDVPAVWHARLEKGPGTHGVDSLRVQLEPWVDGALLPAPRANSGMLKGEGEWRRYNIDAAPMLRTMTRLQERGFRSVDRGPNCCEKMYGYDFTTVAQLLESVAPEIVIDWGEIPPMELVAQGKVCKPEHTVALERISERPPSFRVNVRATVGGHAVDVAHVLANSFQGDNVYQYQYHYSQFTNSSRNEDRLVQIAPTHLARVNSDAWRQFIDAVRPILDAAKRVGNQWRLGRGALIGLQNQGIELPKHEFVTALRAEIEALLAAKKAPGPETIAGIDDCTFAPFQGTGVNWLLALREHGYGGVLADDRGLGKTLEALGAIAQYRNLERLAGRGAPPAIVVMERREVEGWKKHRRDHLGGLKAHFEYGPERLRSTEELSKQDIVLTTYNLLLSNLQMFLDLNPDFVFLDEAKAVKNVSSKRWQAVAQFEGASIVPITGTPLDRNINDAWALMELAVPGALGRQAKFRARYKGLEGRNDQEALADLAKIRAMQAPFVLRRKKTEVANQLPEKLQITQPVTMSDEGAERYEALRARLEIEKNQIFDSMPLHKARFKVDPLVKRLREACAKVGTKAKPTDKGEYLVEMVQELLEADHRILIFSHFNQVVTGIAELLRSHGIDCAEYVGGNAKQRDREVKSFKDGRAKVMVLSEWGSSALDLPEADTVIISDTWINLAQEEQMGDRAHRWVSKKDVTVFKLALADSIEMVATEILERSVASAEAIYTDTGAGVSSLTLSREDYDRMFAVSPAR